MFSTLIKFMNFGGSVDNIEMHSSQMVTVQDSAFCNILLLDVNGTTFWFVHRETFTLNFQVRLFVMRVNLLHP